MKFLVAIVASCLLTLNGACDDSVMKTDRTVSIILQRITPGMTRTEVEERLNAIPDAHFVYTSREHILPAEERTFAGTPLGGRISVTTPLEIKGLTKASGHVLVEFDEQDRVINVRVD